MKTKTTTAKKPATPERKKRTGNRHDPDKVLFGGYVTPEFKAIAMLTASMRKTDCLTLMKNGVYGEATAAGIMKNGEVLPQFTRTIAAMANHIRLNRENRKTKETKGE